MFAAIKANVTYIHRRGSHIDNTQDCCVITRVQKAALLLKKKKMLETAGASTMNERQRTSNSIEKEDAAL